MIFGLDYDKTYDAAEDLWNNFIIYAYSSGHFVYITTMRFPDNPIKMDKDIRNKITDIIYTEEKAKEPFCEALGIRVEVWIDDDVRKVYTDYKDLPEKK